ncbi:hypothetical protein SALBM217S_06361 [Streptomyces griseoloalbus]
MTVDGKALARPKRIIAATSAVTVGTCEAAPATKGCRVLEFVYASSTTATASAFGDFKDQVLRDPGVGDLAGRGRLDGHAGGQVRLRRRSDGCARRGIRGSRRR